jgi:uncharacterized protein DUF433
MLEILSEKAPSDQAWYGIRLEFPVQRNLMCMVRKEMLMTKKPPLVRLDENGVVFVGDHKVSMDDINASHSKGSSMESMLARFPDLTREELQAALDYHAAAGADFVPRGPQQRDADWRRWNATLAEDLGTDTPPNEPLEKR